MADPAMRSPWLIAVLCLSACGGQDAGQPVADAPVAVPAPVGPAAPVPIALPGADVAASRAVLDAWLDAMNRHDGDAASALLAEDVVVFDALRANVSRGRGEASGVHAMYLRAVPDGQWSLRGEPVVGADGYSYEWTLTGTNLGDWTSYLRGRGQKIDFKGVSIVRLREGKIAYQANYFDTNTLGAQTGW